MKKTETKPKKSEKKVVPAAVELPPFVDESFEAAALAKTAARFAPPPVSESHFDKLRVGIASPQDIRAWSRGEVKKPETINYRTFKPERDGLFCERIFGPTKDWECYCGKYKKVKFKGVICDRCSVEVTRARVRRRRMGHIELAAPVAHLWYVKGVPSPMSLVLDMSPRNLEKILYFASYVVTKADTGAITRNLSKIRGAIDQHLAEIKEGAVAREAVLRKELAELEAKQAKDPAAVGADEVHKKAKEVEGEVQTQKSNAVDSEKELNESFQKLSEVEKRKLLTDQEFRGLQKLMEAVAKKLGKGYDKLFVAGMGANAVKDLLADIDLEKLARELRVTIIETAGAKRARSIKRLEVVESFRKSKNRPEWMILDTIPVMPPELRPMVQLDGGRFATSDLNDLYRRIINRNNRLKRIIEIKAPESIINHEKRLLQEAVDALIDNTRRQRPVTGSNGRPLKSLSDLLKGKEGRFRKNLLGKRVDYSGRSVIVVGPHLQLHQCGLPKEMAIELFKPFVMKRIVEKGLTANIKTAKRLVDRMRDEVWDALEEVVHEHPVLLNRAPTLHRLGIQAFVPVLVDGKAIQVHPLVCPAYNADFDGDQMAVHVPLFPEAQAEALLLMLSTNNLFSPANGRPVMSPEYDIVLGCYYLSQLTENPYPTGLHRVFNSMADVVTAAEDVRSPLDLHVPVVVRVPRSLKVVKDKWELSGTEWPHPLDEASKNRVALVEKSRRQTQRDFVYLETTAGRIIFNEVMALKVGFLNDVVDKPRLRELVLEVFKACGNERTVRFLDEVKALGFRYGTRSGLTISAMDMEVECGRDAIVKETERKVEQTNRDYEDLIISEGERERKIVDHWIRASEQVIDSIKGQVARFNPLFMMANSGARGNWRQITQIVGMRGLMSDPSGRFIEDLPIRHNFHEGLNLLEYFISTHGARKGLADTALRTADAGYLTRRLVDVSQDVIIRSEDCGTNNGILMLAPKNADEVALAERVAGRVPLENVKHPVTKKTLAKAGVEISDEQAEAIKAAAVEKIKVRSPLTCEAGYGICAKCYGRDLATGRPVEIGEAVGIIAAQSIGEPGTQLTMRTFHLGGVAGGGDLPGVANVRKRRQQTLQRLHSDISSGAVTIGTGSVTEHKRNVQKMLKVLEDPVRGLLRVQELFEARKPKGEAITSAVAGTVVEIETGGVRQVIVHSEQHLEGNDLVKGEKVAADVIQARTEKVLLVKGSELTEKIIQELVKSGVRKVTICKEYLVPYRGQLEVKKGDAVDAGQRLTEGPMWPQDVLLQRGLRDVQAYLVAEIQKVYKSQGVTINDKHVEIIVRQMLRKRLIKESGDTDYLPGQTVDRFDYDRENARIRETGGKEATAEWRLLGITEAALQTDSFLSAASFQKTTKVLTEAATKSKFDGLAGLKENVIIGRLIPAGTGLKQHANVEIEVEGLPELPLEEYTLAPLPVVTGADDKGVAVAA